MLVEVEVLVVDVLVEVVEVEMVVVEVDSVEVVVLEVSGTVVVVVTKSDGVVHKQPQISISETNAPSKIGL